MDAEQQLSAELWMATSMDTEQLYAVMSAAMSAVAYAAMFAAVLAIVAERQLVAGF